MIGGCCCEEVLKVFGERKKGRGWVSDGDFWVWLLGFTFA